MSSLPERLLALRKERKLNQEDVVEEFGLSIRSYRRYETGKGEPPVSTLVKIADFYGVSTDYLLGRTDTP